MSPDEYIAQNKYCTKVVDGARWLYESYATPGDAFDAYQEYKKKDKATALYNHGVLMHDNYS